MNKIFFWLLLILGLFSGGLVSAATCPTSNPNGFTCSGSTPYWCGNTSSTGERCENFAHCADYTVNSCFQSGGCANAATTDCGYTKTCNSGYTACGTWPNIVCKANVTITGCSNVNQCAVPPTCSTCSAGYILCSGSCVQNTCESWQTASCGSPLTCTNPTNTVNLGSDSVLSDRLKNSSNPLVTILSSGNVGIGTSTPTGILSLNSGVNALNFSKTDPALWNYNNTQYLRFDNLLSDSLSVIGGLRSSSGTLYLGGSGVSTILGNLGIGTNNPENADGWARVLGVYGADHAKAIVTTNAIQTGVWSHNAGFYGAPAGGIAGTKTNHPYSLITNGAARLTINTSGNVGVGTTAPGAKLAINGSVLNYNSSVATRHYRDVAFYTYNGGVTGTMKITMPKHWSTTMLQAVIKGYNYSANGAWEVELSGYNYNSPNSWINVTAEIKGKAPFSSVRLASDGVNNVILLGTTTTAWSYPKITVTDVITGHSNIDGWDSGWSIAPITDESAMVNVVTPAVPYFWNASGNLGIGTTTPGYKLDVQGGQVNSSGGLCMAGVCKASWDEVGMNGQMSTDLNMGNHDILAVNKLTVTTIDPLYSIKGVKYSTFASAIVGGVKEEYVGRILVNRFNEKEKYYEKIIDFNQEVIGSDLWVWYHAVDFNDDNVEIFLTPRNTFSQNYSFIKDSKIYIRSDKPVEISLRLVGRRVDWQKWPTKALNQNEQAGIVIN